MSESHCIKQFLVPPAELAELAELWPPVSSNPDTSGPLLNPELEACATVKELFYRGWIRADILFHELSEGAKDGQALQTGRVFD